MRRLALAVTCAMMATTSAAHADDRSIPAEKWMHTRCVGALRVRQHIEEAAAGLQTLPGPLDVRLLRDSLAEVLGVGADELRTFRDRMMTAGIPDVEHGDEYARAVTEASDHSRAVLRHAQRRTARLAVDDPSRLARQMKQIIDETGEAVEKLGRDPEGFDRTSNDLTRIMDQDRACRRLKRGAGA